MQTSPLRRISNRLLVGAACVSALLNGCMVGPDFVPPPPPHTARFTSAELPDTLAPGFDETAQHFDLRAQIPAEWWELFRSSRLTEIVQAGIAGNQTLVSALATLAQAQDMLAVARAAFYPQVTGSATAQRQQTSGSRSQVQHTSTFNVLSLGPTVTYSPDVFGGTRRHVEEEAALADTQRYQLAAAYLTLTGNIVAQAINIAGARLQIQANEEIVADDTRNLDLVRAKYDAGKAAQGDVLTAETQLANDRALLPPLQQQLSVARHALAILIGKFPAEWSAPEFDLAEFQLPGDLPVSLPSELVHQRPDIMAAEAQLHAASAAIGVATAQLYPSINLSASAGQQALTPEALFDASSTFWTLASGLAAPIFEGGALMAQKQAAVDAYQGSLAIYQQTVLQAFDQVADVLEALGHDAALVADERHASDLAHATLDLQQLSYSEGKSSLLQLLDSARLDQQARLGYARAQAQRFQDTTQLFVAMGGQWWNSPLDPAVASKG